MNQSQPDRLRRNVTNVIAAHFLPSPFLTILVTDDGDEICW